MVDEGSYLAPTLVSKTPIAVYLSKLENGWTSKVAAKNIEIYHHMSTDSKNDGKKERQTDVRAEIKYVSTFYSREAEDDFTAFTYRKFQIVHCRSTPRELIQTSSDFHCSKWIFDGTTIEISDASILALVHKRIEIQPHTVPAMSTLIKQLVQYYRWWKYTKKGFAASIDPTKHGNKILLKRKFPFARGVLAAWMVDRNGQGCLTEGRDRIIPERLGVVPEQTIEFID